MERDALEHIAKMYPHSAESDYALSVLEQLAKQPDKFEHARQNAQAWLESIQYMVNRLDHAQSCDGDDEDCELAEWLQAGDAEHEFIDYHDADAAREAIEESALSVEVNGSWAPGSEPEATGFEILLTTGGPALRIVGELGEYSEPSRAWLEMQDWGTSWEWFSGDSDILKFASVFYFGD